MERPRPRAAHPRSYLFTVRVWEEELGEGTAEARMQVRHVLSGETRYFRAWADMLAYIQVKMETLDAEDA